MNNQSADIMVVPTSGDGRGNDNHFGKGAPDGKGGQFAPKGQSSLGTESNEVSDMKKALEMLRERKKVPTLRNFYINRQQKTARRLANLTDEEKRIQDEIRPYARELLDNCLFTIKISFWDLSKVLNDGFYNNSVYRGDSRWTKSQILFAHNLDRNGDPKTLEKYGLMQSKNIKSFCNGYGMASGYSSAENISLVLKKNNFKDRTTYLFGNSPFHDEEWYPQKYNAPWDVCTMSRHYGKLDEQMLQTFKENTNAPQNIVSRYASSRYIECQYHGDVKLEDISKIIIGYRGAWDANVMPEEKKAFALLCKEKGVKCLVAKGDGEHMEEMNIDEQGNIYYNIYGNEDIDDD